MAEATGLLKSFSVNNGWTGIEVEGAPKGISTKKPDVAAAVKELVGTTVTISYTEKDSDKINENTGKPYVNRWLNSVVPAANGQQAQDPAPAVTPAAPDHAAAASPSTAGPDLTTRERAWLAAAFLSIKAPSFDGAKALSRRIYQDILSDDWQEQGFNAPAKSEDDIPF